MMGKGKGKGDEHACRINYLFQAGQLVAKDVPQLSQYYGQVLTVVTEKTAPKKDFTMKRSMCKKCHAVLKVGDNATYRVRKNKRRKGAPVMVIGCLLCGERKRLPATKGCPQLRAEREGKFIQSEANSNTAAVIVSSSNQASPGDTNDSNNSNKSSEPEKLSAGGGAEISNHDAKFTDLTN